MLKKQKGEKADHHYWKLNPETGELHQVVQEYTTCSTRLAIGKDFYDEFKNDLRKGYYTQNGKLQKIPAYYLGLIERDDPKLYKKIKRERTRYAKENGENDLLRLLQMEDHRKYKANKLPRDKQ